MIIYKNYLSQGLVLPYIHTLLLEDDRKSGDFYTQLLFHRNIVIGFYFSKCMKEQIISLKQSLTASQTSKKLSGHLITYNWDLPSSYLTFYRHRKGKNDTFPRMLTLVSGTRCKQSF